MNWLQSEYVERRLSSGTTVHFEVTEAGSSSLDDIPEVLLVHRQFTIDSDTEITITLPNGVDLNVQC